MTKKEFLPISTGLIAAYPNAKIMGDEASLELWYRMLADIDAEVVENAIMEYISTNVFPPNIAEIRKLCVERYKQPIPSFDEAWGVVQTAIQRYGRDRPDEAYATMDDLTREVVKNLGWYNLCVCDNQTASRANFREAYNARAEEMQRQRQLPAFVAQEKAALQQHYVPAIEDRTAPRLRLEDTREDVRDSMTPEQLEERARRWEETKRRVLGG